MRHEAMSGWAGYTHHARALDNQLPSFQTCTIYGTGGGVVPNLLSRYRAQGERSVRR